MTDMFHNSCKSWFLDICCLEVILGMDWLSTNHILIDCGRKKLIFPGLEGMQVISA